MAKYRKHRIQRDGKHHGRRKRRIRWEKSMGIDIRLAVCVGVEPQKRFHKYIEG